MHKLSKRDEDGDTAAGGARPVQPAPEALTLDDARFIHDLYLRGGAKKFVNHRSRTHTLRDLTRLGGAGVIETLQSVRGNVQIMLTVRGQQLLPQALKAIAEQAGARGRGA